MMNPLSPVEDSKPAMCLSPQEKLKNVGPQRAKRSQVASGAGANETKKTRRDDMVKTDFELDGWISDDYLRAMDLDDSLNQDIDWVDHDEMELSLSMDVLGQEDQTTSDDVQDFAFDMRGALALDESVEMVSPFVDPAYIHHLDASHTKDAEKLLMSFDTMNFKIPSPTSSSRKRVSTFIEKEAEEDDDDEDRKPLPLETKAVDSTSQTAKSTRTDKLGGEKTSTPASLGSVTAPVDSLLSILTVGASTSSSHSSDKKIGSYSPAARKLRLEKFHAKRKNRTWKKSIKYDCRKKLADDRPRIKGRFVRVLENASDAKTDGRPCTSTATSPAAAAATHSVTCVSTLNPSPASVTKSQPLAAPSTNAAAAALPLARMIASV